MFGPNDRDGLLGTALEIEESDSVLGISRRELPCNVGESVLAEGLEGSVAGMYFALETQTFSSEPNPMAGNGFVFAVVVVGC